MKLWYSRYIAAEHVKFINNYSRSINTYALAGFNLKYLSLDQQVQNKLAVKVSKLGVSDVDRIKFFSTPALFMTQKKFYCDTCNVLQRDEQLYVFIHLYSRGEFIGYRFIGLVRANSIASFHQLVQKKLENSWPQWV